MKFIYFKILQCSPYHGGGQYVNIYTYGEWDFEDAGDVLLWGSLSGVLGDKLFGVDAGGSV